jgi:hypothetical protein
MAWTSSRGTRARGAPVSRLGLGKDVQREARERLLRRLSAEVLDGLRHGHFEFTLTCEVIGEGRRRLVLHAGKSYRFVIPADACAPPTDDPRHESVNDTHD